MIWRTQEDSIIFMIKRFACRVKLHSFCFWPSPYLKQWLRITIYWTVEVRRPPFALVWVTSASFYWTTAVDQCQWSLLLLVLLQLLRLFRALLQTIGCTKATGKTHTHMVHEVRASRPNITTTVTIIMHYIKQLKELKRALTIRSQHPGRWKSVNDDNGRSEGDIGMAISISRIWRQHTWCSSAAGERLLERIDSL